MMKPFTKIVTFMTPSVKESDLIVDDKVKMYLTFNFFFFSTVVRDKLNAQY